MFALLVIGGFIYQNSLTPDSNGDGEVLVSSGIEEVTSLEELESLVGFDVEHVTDLPFETSEIEFVSYSGEMAEIIYSGDEQTITFRKSVGDEDNTGDYNEYGNEITATVDNIDILMKGNSTGYCNVTWTDGTYSYSFVSDIEITEDVWMEIIDQIIQ